MDAEVVVPKSRATWRRRIAALAIFALIPAGVLLAAWRIGDPNSRTCSASPPDAPASARPAITQVAANWKAFFSSAQTAAHENQLLQNGHAFAELLAAQAKSGQFGGTTAGVSKVTLISPRRARVIFSVCVSGSPVILSKRGLAVWQDGSWRVSDASFCDLLALEYPGKLATRLCRGHG